ncbi:MAG: glycosyltransferase family 4 protein [Bacteroidales bacterium]
MALRSPPSPPAPSVLLTVEPPGVVWPHVETLVRELSALGAEVTVAALTHLRTGQRVEFSAIPGVELVPCPHPADCPSEHLYRRTRIADWLLGVEEVLNPDVVHLTGYLHAGLPWCGRVLVAGHPGSGAAYGRLDAEQRRICRAAFQHGLRGADLVVTPTEAMMSALTRHFGIPAGRVIRDGRDPARFTPGLKEPVILSVGMLREDPGQRSALEAAAPRLPWPVVVAGEQVDADGHAVRLEGVSGLGRVHPSQLVPWFNRAAIYVALTAEGPGTWAMEAALAGTALVLGDTAALREIWSGAALFVSPNDPDAVAAGLRTLLADRRLREAMGLAARRRAMRHPARAMAEAYLSAYRDVVAARAPNQFAAERQG